MVMKLKESETKLENMLVDSIPENVEVPAEETEGVVIVEIPATDDSTESKTVCPTETSAVPVPSVKNTPDVINNNLSKKVTNIENEQINKSMNNIRNEGESHSQEEINKPSDDVTENAQQLSGPPDNAVGTEESNKENVIQAVGLGEIRKDDQELKDMLRKNILSCVEKISRIEEMKTKKKDSNTSNQVFVYYCELWSVSLCCQQNYP